MTETLVRDTLAKAPTSERRYVTNADATCRMFANDLVERLSHVRPWVPHVIFVPVIAIAFFAGIERQGLTQAAVWAIGGLLVWTIAEYVIHRFAFHPPQWIEDDTRRIASRLGPDDAVIPALPTLRHKFYFLVHGVHHDYPNDSTRLVMPPSVSIPLAFVFYHLFQAAVGAVRRRPRSPASSRATSPTTRSTSPPITSGRAPRSAARSSGATSGITMRIRRSDFGVSSPLWDALMGTMSPDENPRGTAQG